MTVYIQGEPFVMYTTEEERQTAPDVLLKGYCLELLAKLEESLGFRSEVYVVPDGNYGGQDPITNEWNGIIRDIIDGVSETALYALTDSYLNGVFGNYKYE